MKEKRREKYLPQSHDDFLERRDNMRPWNIPLVAQFEENKMCSCSSSPKPTLAQCLKE